MNNQINGVNPNADNADDLAMDADKVIAVNGETYVGI